MGAETHIDIRRLQEGGDTPSSVDIYSSDQSVDVTKVNEGEYNLKVSQDIIDALNSKQDIPIAGGLQTNGIEARYMGVNLSGYPNIMISAPVGSYVPLFEIDAYNNGKSQLSFEIISREDSAGYYSRFVFVSRANSHLFMRLDFYNKYLGGTQGAFDQNAIVLVVSGSKYLICKKVLSPNFDCCVISDIYRDQDVYCHIYKYQSVIVQSTDPYLRRAEAMTTWRGLNIETNGEQPVDLQRLSENTIYDDTTTQVGVTNVQDALENIFTRLSAANI